MNLKNGGTGKKQKDLKGGVFRVLREIEKRRILHYLQFAENKVDLLHFVQWLEAYSDGLFHVNIKDREWLENHKKSLQEGKNGI